jgi:hypothetical protein
MKIINGHELEIGMKVFEWEDGVILSIEERYPNIIRAVTDKGVFACGALAWMTVHLED